ncbi:hypothetical protein AAHA92_20609 [Salvia divinorum]|uniref:Uncharacterized protein n=1 Tax=Salvia divinorum TaxID=28513 RepID=A0ABD1GHU0_SALDI
MVLSELMDLMVQLSLSCWTKHELLDAGIDIVFIAEIFGWFLDQFPSEGGSGETKEDLWVALDQFPKKGPTCSCSLLVTMDRSGNPNFFGCASNQSKLFCIAVSEWHQWLPFLEYLRFDGWADLYQMLGLLWLTEIDGYYFGCIIFRYSVSWVSVLSPPPIGSSVFICSDLFPRVESCNSACERGLPPAQPVPSPVKRGGGSIEEFTSCEDLNICKKIHGLAIHWKMHGPPPDL